MDVPGFPALTPFDTGRGLAGSSLRGREAGRMPLRSGPSAGTHRAQRTERRPPMKPLVQNLLALAAGAAIGAAICALVLHIFVLKPLATRGKQVHDLVDARAWVYVLDEYRELHGRYPDSLEEAIASRQGKKRLPPLLDNWGNPFHYQSDGQAFLLVGFGRDGLCDRDEVRTYWEDASGSARDHRKTCDDPNNDTVLTEKGVQQSCGK